MAEETPEPPLYFRQVLDAELAEVALGRRARAAAAPPIAVPATPEEPERAPDPAGAFRRAHEMRLSGLAFSGGGIRSATFNLGLIQALSELGLLKLFDYVSTVSGGGYIGGWLAAALKRAPGSFDELAEVLNPPPREVRGPREDRRVRFLRSYSNYLTPRLGLLGDDTWAVIAIYLRNFLLNLTIVVAALSALLLLPRIALWAVQQVNSLWVLGLASLVASVVALLFIWRNLGDLPLGPEEDFAHYSQPAWIFRWVLLPGALSALLMAGFLWNVVAQPEVIPFLEKGWWSWPLVSALAYTACSLPAGLFLPKANRRSLTFFLATFLAGGLGGAMLTAVVLLLARWQGATAIGPPTPEGLVFGLAFAPPLLLLIYILSGMFHLGIEGSSMPDERREWLSRLGGQLLLIALAWTGLFAVALWSPMLVTEARPWGQVALSSAWLAATLTGVLAGRGEQADDSRRDRLLDRAARLAPPVFVVGLLIILATGIDGLLRLLGGAAAWQLDAGNPWTQNLVEQARVVRTSLDVPEALFLGLVLAAGIALLLSWRVDVNEFSMHLFYRNRLARCYLGASNAGRKPNPFTGFDSGDDLPLSRLRPGRGYAGPLPILNTAINLVHGEELAWQERKAASFTFTPLHSGYDLARADADGKDDADKADGKDEAAGGSYRPTERYAYPQGISLGTALAVSGAAASPNMGYHTSPALSFLMTVFNVRLGWWLGNPAHPTAWRLPGPPIGLLYLFSELLGRTNARSSFVYLSDGGHFENLGIYELVKRRCRLIVASDAGQDRTSVFCDLGNAVRKCRNDLGIDIELETAALARLLPTRLTTRHCAVGRIRYDRVDPGAEPGVLVYLKPSLSGDEPADLLNYGALCPDFPHESTGDQFFGESQFESYRKLGYHIGASVLAGAVAASRVEDTGAISPEPLAESLLAAWGPGGRA